MKSFASFANPTLPVQAACVFVFGKAAVALDNAATNKPNFSQSQQPAYWSANDQEPPGRGGCA